MCLFLNNGTINIIFEPCINILFTYVKSLSGFEAMDGNISRLNLLSLLISYVYIS
jgi:hypothetical protein